MAFQGYYISINGNNFTNPMPSKYKIYPKIIQDLDSYRTASGKLHRNPLAHTPAKIELAFPPMTMAQFRAYYNAMDNNYLNVTYYDIATDSYKTAQMYHNDIVIEEVNTAGTTKHINTWEINLTGY